ncbi:energy transducer TonB [Accumulibacter sp.]|uniref:energy transducer TonB n=1 Tax=Accumulibacter sp. TaxID=2053492 RepID=UPI0026173DBF|nr:energy transducer TonB [Accumulibacter sp.]
MWSRLIPAFAVSLALHASLLLPDALKLGAAPVRPSLEASLRLPAKRLPATDDALLKNTLATDKIPPHVKPPPPAPAARTASPADKTTAKRSVDAAQRKLSQHLYYPPEAIARGLEGEVRLMLTLGEDGSILDVGVASSSGQPILDKAAVRAAWAMSRVNWAQSREFILPVIFRLD